MLAVVLRSGLEPEDGTHMTIHSVSIITTGLALVLSSACATDYLDLASNSIKEEQYEAAEELLRQGASEGDRRCDYYLGVLLLSGELSGRRDPTAGSRWLLNAANAGLPQAQLDLGRLHAAGNGVDKNMTRAAAWYRKAADQGVSAAQVELGLLYAAGTGVEQDTKSAADWFRKAAKNGDPLGQAALGLATFQGVGVEKNVVDGYVWTKLAANQGNTEAWSKLRTMTSQMTEKELKKARYEVSKSSIKPAERDRFRTKIRIFDSKRSQSGINQRRSGGLGR